MQILEHVRKRPTQKVNLYEKVQIPPLKKESSDKALPGR
jgi:hypothetical protein